MKKLLLLTCLSFFTAFVYGQGKLGYLSFVTGGTSAANNLNPQNNPIEANFKDAFLTNMTLSRGSGMPYTNNSTYSYVALLPAGGTRADAITNNVYYELKLNAVNKYMYLKNLTARLRTADAWTSADVTYRWFYSVGNTTNFVEIGASDVLLGFTNTNGDIEPTIDLSGIAVLQHLAPNTDVFFRVYAWGAKAKQVDGITDVTATSRGFGFGKSSATTTELITVGGFLTEAPLMAAWSFTGINASTSTTVNTTYQEPWAKKNDVVNTLEVARGVGLEAGSLSNAYAVSYIDALAPASFPTNYNEAVTNDTYYAIQLKGQAADYTQILGYRFKFRGNTTTATTARWKLLIGDNNNDISASSPVLDLGADISIASNSDGVYYFLGLNDNDVSAVIPPNKNAELRLYVWGGSSETGVFGLGRLPDENHLQIYGKTITLAELQVLPVTLTSFKATKQSSAVRLNWLTSFEKDNSHFNILRAGNDKKFVSIGKINGAGNSSVAKEYSLTDYKPLAGANYYKLTQTDFNGDPKEVGDVQYVQFDLSNTSLTVVQQLGQSEVKAILTVTKSDKANVAIYNISGNTLYQAQINVNNGINEISAPVNLNKGVYILKVKTLSGEAWQTKFVR